MDDLGYPDAVVGKDLLTTDLLDLCVPKTRSVLIA
jgi:hypothetical protein